MGQDDAPDPLPQEANVEVDEQAEWLPRRLEVREQLRQMDGEDALAGFQFEYQSIRHHEVEPGVADRDTLVFQRERNLPTERSSSQGELD